MASRSIRIALTRAAVSGAFIALLAGIAWSGRSAYEEWREAWIVESLGKGGHVIVLRHADPNSEKRENFTENTPAAAFENCATQSNLTDEGREDAAQIGVTLRRWNVPIGEVVALPLCRTRETASLAFGPKITLDAKLYDDAYLKSLVSQAPRQGNTILVGTEDQAYRLVGARLKPGEAAVFLPDAQRGFLYLGKLDQDDLDP